MSPPALAESAGPPAISSRIHSRRLPPSDPPPKPGHPRKPFPLNPALPRLHAPKVPASCRSRPPATAITRLSFSQSASILPPMEHSIPALLQDWSFSARLDRRPLTHRLALSMGLVASEPQPSPSRHHRSPRLLPCRRRGSGPGIPLPALVALQQELLIGKAAQQILIGLLAPPLLWLACPVHILLRALPAARPPLDRRNTQGLHPLRPFHPPRLASPRPLALCFQRLPPLARACRLQPPARPSCTLPSRTLGRLDYIHALLVASARNRTPPSSRYAPHCWLSLHNSRR